MRFVRDDIGREVRMPVAIDRVVSLAPSLTESIFAAGAGGKLVGVTTYCDHPPAARAIDKVGDTQTPNIERIVALRPQVVFVSTASQLESYTNILDEQGIAFFVIDVRNIDDVPKVVRLLGELLGTLDAADAAALELHRRIEAISARMKEDGGELPRMFLQLSDEPLFTIGRDSFLTDVIRKAGGRSSTEDVPTAYPKLSKETAAALEPDGIILSESADNRSPNAAFRGSRAVRTGQVFRINADIISRPGPRLVDALEEIAGFIESLPAGGPGAASGANKPVE